MQDEQKDRWDGWIKTPEYIERLQVIENYVCALSEQTDTSYYTPHDASHCLAVEKMVKTLIAKSEVKLSDLENFILFSAVWTHDLGMFHNIATEFFNVQNIPIRSPQIIRDIHDEISAWRVSSEGGEILRIPSERGDKKSKSAVDNMLRNYAYTINVISQFHRMTTDIKDCPRERFLKEEKIRARLLACLLRLGDTLHVDSSRFDRRLYDMLQIGQLDRSARLHWLKSYVVSNVYLDPKNETVFINIDLSAYNKSSQSNEVGWEESSKNLQTVIINGVLEDVLAVRETFMEYGMPAYSLVKPNVAYVPGYSKKDTKDLAGVINDLGIAFSPNTSKVIEKALDSVTSLCNTDFERSDHYYTQMNQLILYLQEMRVFRPCHVGLGKIIKGVSEAFELPIGDHRDVTNAQVKKSQKAIAGVINEIRKTRGGCAQGLYGKCKDNLRELEGVENIILFAYSEMVTKFLEEYGKHHPSWKRKLKLFVLECSGKRRLASDNSIEFSDGLYYALQLSKHNFKNIHLLPDTSFGSLVYNFNNKHLFNWDNVPGIDNDGLLEYIKDNLDISWVESAEIKKSDDGKAIQIRRGGNSAEIKIDEAEENATLEISDGRIHNLTVKKENGKLNIYKNTNEIAKSLVLFGVNGISEEDNDCGHSSGHLMIAIVANHYKIPVKVIADSFKIGKIDWRPAAKRETPWLTGQRHILNDIKKHNIKLINYLEDRIPRELINEIIIDGHNIRGGQDLSANAERV